jgi:hypothetical protein
MRKILTLNSKIIKIAGSIIYTLIQSGSFIIYNNDDDIILLDDDTYLVWE